MKNHITLTDFHIKLNRELVFHLIDCYPDSPIYNEVVEEYTDLKNEVYSALKPEAVIQFGNLNPLSGIKDYKADSPACYVLWTVGNKISQLSSRYFSEGNYLAAMLINAMADDYLFQMDREITKVIKEQCLLKHCGVKKRLEIPADIPLEVQKTILIESGADKELNMGITEGYMFTTVKSNCFILILSEDESLAEIEHDCRSCNLRDCKMRNIQGVSVEVIRGCSSKCITLRCGESLMDALVRNDVYIPAACGGRGACGKCKIQVLKGNLEQTPEDLKFIRKDELMNGFRLSCRAFPKEDCIIKLDNKDESDFEIVTENDMRAFPEDNSAASYRKTSENTSDSIIKYSKTDAKKTDTNLTPGFASKDKSNPGDDYGIAVDIGTTTIAISLIKLTIKQTIKTYVTVNKQRSFGADVISRIKASNEGRKDELQDLLRKALLEGFISVITDAGIDKNQVKKIAIAGNTTIEHLFMGYSCETLGVYPFTPVNIKTIEKDFREAFESDYLNCPVTLLPGISTYVGADIVAGLTICNFDQEELPCILIDLGTNGEIAIGNRERILVSSTAAGPAFEGGNISCGVGSIAGAICGLSIEEGLTAYKTIGNKPPVGICGTGVIETVFELLNAGFIDETGLLQDKYFNDGYPVSGNILFTQKDIREVQLAKAAVCAGIETLILRYGITLDQIDTVYLAGGFGYKINIEKAGKIGLLPKKLLTKVKAIGNSSLSGAVQYLTEKETMKRMENIVSISKEINLSNDRDFNDLYIENMYFE